MTDTATPPTDPTPPPAAPPAAPPADLSPEEVARVQAIDTPPAASTPPAEPPVADPEPKRNRAEERIQQLIAERNAALDFAERIQKLAAGTTPPAAPAAPAADPAPSLDAFDSTEKWAAAHAAWSQREIGRQTAAAVSSTLTAREAQTAEQTTIRAYTDRLAAYEAANPGVRALIADPRLPITKEMGAVIVASEHGPALAHHFAMNPAEAARVSQLPPMLAAAAIGRIEAGIVARAAAPKPPAKPKASSAPPPPTPLSGNGSPTVDLNNCSLAEYVKIRGEQARARARGGR